MTRNEYISLRKNEAWRKAKAALQEVWEWEGQRYSTGDGKLKFEDIKEPIDQFVEMMESEGYVE